VFGEEDETKSSRVYRTFGKGICQGDRLAMGDTKTEKGTPDNGGKERLTETAI